MNQICAHLLGVAWAQFASQQGGSVRLEVSSFIALVCQRKEMLDIVIVPWTGKKY